MEKKEFQIDDFLYDYIISDISKEYDWLKDIKNINNLENYINTIIKLHLKINNVFEYLDFLNIIRKLNEVIKSELPHINNELFENVYLLFTMYCVSGNDVLKQSLKITEKKIKDNLIQNFNKIFPNWEFIKDEYYIENVGFIDILAKDKETNRYVIIEIKKDETNPNKQLLKYSKDFINPILVGITDMDKKKYKNNIIYFKTKDILNKLKQLEGKYERCREKVKQYIDLVGTDVKFINGGKLIEE